MILIDHLTLDFSGTPLFEDISFLVNPKEKVALTGKNGAGKTSLLRMVAGQLEPTSGRISTPKGVTIGYLPQHLLVNDERTVIEEVKVAFSDLLAIQKNIETISSELAERTDYESQSYNDLIEKLALENERLLLYDSNNMVAEIEKTPTDVVVTFGAGNIENHCAEIAEAVKLKVES